MNKISGALKLKGLNAQCLIDQEIVDYYYSLLPKSIGALKPGHPAHITVVREYEGVTPQIIDLFASYEGHLINFSYGPQLIYRVGPHFIIDCRSKEMEDLRVRCGLSPLRIPFDCFHFTVGFIKDF